MAIPISLIHWAKALVLRDAFHGALEIPGSGAPVSDTLVISGWTFSRRAPVEQIEAFLGSVSLGRLTYGIERPDVARAFPRHDVALSGYATAIPLHPSIRGRHTLAVRVTDRQGHVTQYRRAIAIRTASRERVATQATPHLEVRDAADQDSRRAMPIRRDAQSERAATALAQLEDVIARYRSQHGRPPAILDWDAGLAATGGKHLVFVPPASNGGATLPYADHSVDIVVTAAGRPEFAAEAIRIAATAAITVDADGIKTVWSAPATANTSPRVSIIIPVHGQLEHTESCLRQLHATLGNDFSGEIIVVDDGSVDATPAALASWAEREPRLRVLTNDRNVGFTQSCNRGARAANGDVLVFLNNDTLPQAGWLPPLVESLRDLRVGAAGSKLVYPDGSLQEAGGVTFADASGWNFGKGDAQPDAPLFNHVRDVDYCSAAALATPRRLFLELGGFDERYAPAYYEDTDYCFALRARGYRVLFQPASVIVHTEGASCGVDERFGVKSAQAVNRITFAGKWRDALVAHPPPLPAIDRAALHRHAVRDSRVRRALVWAPRVPEHDRESGSRRVHDTICFLRDAGWAVTFVAESATGGQRYVQMLEQMGVAVYAGKETQGAGAAYLPDASELLTHGAFDIAILHFWWLAERHLPSIRRHSPSTTVLVDSVDLEFLRRARSKYQARQMVRLPPGTTVETLDNGDAAAMMRELNVYAAADGVLTVSAKEAALINDLFADASRAHVVPDAEDLRQSPLCFAARRGLLFLANFRHPPNIDALAFLTREIVPKLPRDLLNKHPISLVGNALTESLVDQCGAGVDGLHVVGWVPSVEPYLERARATIVPLRNGAGTKRKLIQAAMIGTPSVSTHFGVEGLNLSDGEQVIVADDPDEFAKGVARLVDDEALWGRLASSGRKAALAAHGRETVRARFHEVVETIIASGARTS